MKGREGACSPLPPSPASLLFVIGEYEWNIDEATARKSHVALAL